MNWTCIRCRGPVTEDPFGWWCPACQEDTAAVEAKPITRQQRIRICVLFRDLGEVHRATRMRRLSDLTGRPISDYGDLITYEATRIVIPALEEETRGVRR